MTDDNYELRKANANLDYASLEIGKLRTERDTYRRQRDELVEAVKRYIDADFGSDEETIAGSAMAQMIDDLIEQEDAK